MRCWIFLAAIAMAPMAFADDSALIVGTWAIKMKATTSTCSDITQGTSKAEQWLINSDDTKYSIDVSGNKDKKMTYSADLNGRELSGTYTLRDLFGDPAADASFKLTINRNGQKATGQRVITRIHPDACTVVYDLMAKKIF